jgi:hypothetical protein
MLRLTVLTAVKLNGKPQLRTIEVEHVGAGRMLASEAQSIEAICSKLAP